MTALLRFPGGARHDAAVDAWFDARDPVLSSIARTWFDVMRQCGDDVRELLHDGCPTMCVGDAGCAYVNVYTAHVNVGFFQGAALDDPLGLLQGTGRLMRHVQLRPDASPNAIALRALIQRAYADMQRRVAQERQSFT